MMILTIKTDTSVCDLGLYSDDAKLTGKTWEAGRQLAAQLPEAIEVFLKGNQKKFDDLESVIVFKGPGSFTGLRIGATVANTIAYAQSIPIVGTKGESWIQGGLIKLKNGENDKVILPEYESDAHITTPRK